MISHIESKAGIVFQKIGIPQPDDVIKASFRDTLKALTDVEDKVIPIFEDAADKLIASEGGDARRAVCKTLALLSGHHKEMMQDRSMLNGQQDMVTFQMTLDKPFYAISMIWNVIKRYVPEQISGQVRIMRAFKDMTGACFDVPSDIAQRFEDIFKYEESERRVDFKVSRAKELPELKEDDRMQGGYQSYGGGGGYGGG